MNEQEFPFAEDVGNYWKTSTKSTDTWMEDAKKLIRSVGGVIVGDAYSSNAIRGKSAFMLAFKIGEENYKLVFPVLESKTKNEKAARVQAVTFMYHDVKAKVMLAKVFGARTAFLPYLLVDGKTVSEMTNHELSEWIPMMVPMLVSGDNE